ncbi:MAG: phosphatidate cytidylyltransferase [Acetanaerobacterium sp.]
MKQRITTAVIALTILFIVTRFFETPVLNIVIGLLSALAIFELLNNTGYITDKFILSVCVVFSFFFPMLHFEWLNAHIIFVGTVFLVLLGFSYVIGHEKLTLPNICTAFLVSLVVPVVFSVSIVIRDNFFPDGLFYYMLVLGGGWLADSGAYFVGVFFGRHKLAPKISPQKTIEGAVGGIVTTVIGYLLVGLVYYLYCRSIGDTIEISYLVLAISAPVCAVAGIMGDLFASVIKRQTGIKDYGNIFPGHGGVMDRFDSVLFVSPILYVIISLFPIITRG